MFNVDGSFPFITCLTKKKFPREREREREREEKNEKTLFSKFGKFRAVVEAQLTAQSLTI